MPSVLQDPLALSQRLVVLGLICRFHPLTFPRTTLFNLCDLWILELRNSRIVEQDLRFRSL